MTGVIEYKSSDRASGRHPSGGGLSSILVMFFVILVPPLLAIAVLHLWGWDFSVPLVYGAPGADEVWQLATTKTVLDTGWVLENPYMGAPDISTWYGNSGAQTSAIHSVLMGAIGIFVHDAVQVQQYYYLLNFSLISASGYFACRLVGISRAPAVAAGLLFAFTSFRLHTLFFAFLANYFMVPLSIVPAIWIMQGKFASRTTRGEPPRNPIQTFLASVTGWRFPLSILIVVLTAVSDGYYCFFALLLIGFALGFRVLFGDLLKPQMLVAPVFLIGVMIATVSALNYPLIDYRRTHPAEADQDLMKQPTDAEVYSPSLKLLLAPTTDHRIPEMAEFGKYLVDTANFNRKFPLPAGASVPLGTLGQLLLIASMALLGLSIFGRTRNWFRAGGAHGAAGEDDPPLLLVLCIFALFVTLCTISGGIGSLIALVLPAIRAYERFAVFLIFILFMGAGWALTMWMQAPVLPKSTRPGGLNPYQIKRGVGYSLVALISAAALWDQTPKDLLGLSTSAGHEARSARFLAERTFVQRIEASLPTNAMVLNYPWSQYLSNNKYYGWGAFGQFRLYLHSKDLRWSNGGAKGSPGDNWHERNSLLPLSDLLGEARAVGFQGIVLDGMVLPPEEYAAAKRELTDYTGVSALEDPVAKLAFWRLEPLPYKLIYEANFKDVAEIEVARPFEVAQTPLSRTINAQPLEAAISAPSLEFPVGLKRVDHPQLFNLNANDERGFGQVKIAPLDVMKGGVICEGVKPDGPMLGTENISITIDNRSAFDWQLNNGDYPIKVGAQLWRDGGKTHLRDILLDYSAFVRSGKPYLFDFDLSTLRGTEDPEGDTLVRIAILQEGNAWFTAAGNTSCEFHILR